jgi:hypothetical protein
MIAAPVVSRVWAVAAHESAEYQAALAPLGHTAERDIRITEALAE